MSAASIRNGARSVIPANTELRQRELIKLASLASAMADAFRQRGITDMAANLSAEAGVAVFKIAFERWINETNQLDFPQIIRVGSTSRKAMIAEKQNSQDSLDCSCLPASWRRSLSGLNRR